MQRAGLLYRQTAQGGRPGAIAAVEQSQPSLIVLDVMLPGADGRAVSREILHETILRTPFDGLEQTIELR